MALTGDFVERALGEVASEMAFIGHPFHITTYFGSVKTFLTKATKAHSKVFQLLTHCRAIADITKFHNAIINKAAQPFIEVFHILLNLLPLLTKFIIDRFECNNGKRITLVLDELIISCPVEGNILLLDNFNISFTFQISKTGITDIPELTILRLNNNVLIVLDAHEGDNIADVQAIGRSFPTLERCHNTAIDAILFLQNEIHFLLLEKEGRALGVVEGNGSLSVLSAEAFGEMEGVSIIPDEEVALVLADELHANVAELGDECVIEFHYLVSLRVRTGHLGVLVFS